MTTDLRTLSFEEKKKLALNPNTPSEVLKVFATDDSLYVRYWVASNPNTSTETLKVLATDENFTVRWGVARNPNTPPEALPND